MNSYPVKCPGCGEAGEVKESNLREEIQCPACGEKFFPPAPGFWDRQRAASPLARYPWVIAILLLFVLWWTGALSSIVAAVLAVIGLLVAILIQLVALNRKKNGG
jgi:hypothetical protein